VSSDLTGWSEEEVQSLTDELMNRKNISKLSKGGWLIVNFALYLLEKFAELKMYDSNYR
jgi:hypothetical protein